MVLPAEQIEQLVALASKHVKITVDLEHQCVSAYPENINFNFTIDPFRRECLLHGLDDIGLTLQHVTEIDAYELRIKSQQPWLWGKS